MINKPPLNDFFLRYLKLMEKYTKTDLLYIARGGSWLTLGQITSSISSFILAIAFANFFPKEEYGLYKYILSLIAILTITSLPGLGTAITQAVARGYEGSLNRALRAKLAWGTLGSFASLLISAYYYINNNPTLAIAFLLGTIFIPIIDSFAIYEALLIGKRLFNISSLYGMAIKITTALALIIAIWLTNNILIVLLVYFTAYTILRIFFYYRTLAKYPTNTREATSAITYGKHLSLMETINTVAAYLDKLLIFHYLGAAELAVYVIALAPPEQIKALLKNINILALPKFSQQSSLELKRSMSNKMLKLGVLALIMIILYIITAPFIYKIFFPEYLGAVWYSQIFMFSMITIIGLLPLTALEAKGAKKELYIYNTSTSVIQIILLFALIPNYGLLGAVTAKIIFRFSNAIIVYLLFNYKTK